MSTPTASERALLDEIQHLRTQVANLEHERQIAEKIIEASPVMISVVRAPEFVYEMVNPAFQALAPGKQFLGRRFADVWAEVSDPLVEILQNVITTGRAFQFENAPYTIQRRPGAPPEVAYVSYSWIPLAGSDSSPDRVLTIAHETSGSVMHQQAQEALRDSEEILRTVFAGALDAIVTMDGEGRAILWSHAAEKMFGYTAVEMLGQPFHDLIAPAGLRARFQANLPAFHKTGQGAAIGKVMELTALRKDGSEFPMELALSAVKKGLEWQAVGVIRDITERKRAEARLTETTDRLSLAARAGGVGIWDYDVVNGRLIWDDQMFGLYGITGGQFGGAYEAWQAGLHPEDRQRGDEEIQLALRGERDFDTEFRVVWEDGSIHCIRALALVQRDASGRPLHMIGTNWDITAQKQAEEKLRQSEERYRSILATAMDGFWLVGTQGRLLEVNEAYCRMSGYSMQELLAMRILDLEAVESSDDTAAHIQRIMAQGGDRFESRHRRKDGSVFDVEVSVQYRPTAGGRSVAFLRDITERKQAEAVLRERERLLAESQQVAHLGSWAIELPGYQITWSEEAYRVWGVSPQTFVLSFESFLSLIHPDDVAALHEWSRACLADEKPGDLEFRATRSDGTFRILNGRGVLVHDEENRAVRMSGTIQDITDRKRAEEEKAKLEAQFHQAQKMESIGRLAGGVAHDFNNLLTVINGYSQMLVAKLRVGDPMRDDLGEIHQAGERAAGLTRQLLAFSRKQVLEPRKLDVNRVVEDMRPMLVRLVGEDVEVHIALHAASGTVHADPHQLEQVVMNLVVNARDALPGGGKLLVETANVERDESYTRLHPEARVSRYVMLAVSDTGVGMDEETKNRIFDPFFTTKGVGKGTGLGLSMVQGIVAQSGGYVEVYSEKGKGTTFKIYLPAVAEAAAGTERATAVPAVGGKETVLLVEDQAEVRKFAAAVLKSYGYRVIPAESAGDALLFCERERIDLVLTDVIMPNVSGRELADRLETLRPGIKVLFMSGYTDNVIEQHGVLEEGAEFIQKPFSAEDLAGKVRAVLGPPSPAPAARILVAEDESGVRGFLRKVLEEGGYEVIEAADGKQALQQARAGRVDLVITDLVMPEQEGIETIQALRREAPGVGIIAISGAFGGQFLKTAKMLGAVAVLTKPVSAELLLARVVEVLKSRR